MDPGLKLQVCNFYTKWSIAYYYWVLGVLIGVFAGILPSFQHKYDMTNSQLSWVFFFSLLGGIVSMFASAPLITKLGSRALIDLPAFGLCFIFPFIMEMQNITQVAVVLAIYGFCGGGIEVALGMQAVIYEQALDESIMGFFHAVYAAGCVCGSVVTGFLDYEGESSFDICLIVSGVIFSLNLYFRRSLIVFEVEKRLEATGRLETDSIAKLPKKDNITGKKAKGKDDAKYSLVGTEDEDDDVEMSDRQKTISNPIHNNNEEIDNYNNCDSDGDSDSDNCTATATATAAETTVDESGQRKWVVLVLLSIISVTAWITEGVIADWSAIYFCDVVKVSEAKSTIAFSVFQGFLVIGRLCNDYVIDKWITRRIMVILNGFVGSIGLALICYGGELKSFSLGIFGCCVTGLGVAPLWSLCVTGAGNLKGIDAAYALSVVNGVSYLALLSAPPVLGFIAEFTGSVWWIFSLDLIIALLCMPLGFCLPSGF
jgi:MFS family permease